MIEIQIAGAGAGKTYRLSERIIEFHNSNTSHKIIYAITYTNAAKKKIINEVVNKLGKLPELIRIETVHSFFLNEIIYPYSSFTIAEKYNNAASNPLPSEPAYRNRKISQLRNRLVIHNDVVFKKAMIIVDRSNSKHTNRLKREKVDFAVSHINAKISHIFVDEAQDLDSDALRVFKVLGESKIDIYMIGDPKQAIKFPAQFRNFIESCSDENYLIVPKNNISRRVPENILKLSNLFCIDDEVQTSSTTKTGNVNYILSTNPEYDNIIRHYKLNDQLVYIEEKNGSYETHSNNLLFLPSTLEDKLLSYAYSLELDGKIFTKSITSQLVDKIETTTTRDCLQWLQTNYGIALETYEYAELRDNLTAVKKSENGTHVVSSIEAVKGLESETCIFILNQTMFDYLSKNISIDKHYNKNWNKIYVALTRSCENLIFAIDEQLFKRTSIVEVINYFKEFEITEIKTV